MRFLLPLFCVEHGLLWSLRCLSLGIMVITKTMVAAAAWNMSVHKL